MGLGPEDEGVARIVVTGLTADHEPPDPRPAGAADRDGFFSIDVTPIFEAGKVVVDLEVSVDHPAYVPAKVRVPATQVAPVAGVLRYQARVELVRACILVGRVETVRGAPVTTVIGAFRIESGNPEADAAATANSDAMGAYRLRVGRTGKYLVLAAAKAPWAAAQAEAEAVLGQRVDVSPLVMPEGVTIRGRVLYRGGTLTGGRVAAKSSSDGSIDLRLGAESVTWHDGRVLTGEVLVSTDDAGAFELAGLVAGLHRVWVEDAPGITVHMDASRTSERVVEAPAVGITLELQGCIVTVAVVRDGEPVPETTLMLSGRSGGAVVTAGASGEIRVLVPGGSTLHASLFGPAPLSGSADIEVPVNRLEYRHVIDVGGKGAGATLSVTLEGPGQSDVQHAGFALFASEAAEWPFDTRDVDVKDGRFVLASLKPGPVVVRVRPGGPYWGGHGFFLEETLRLDVPQDGEVAARVLLRPAGRLRIAARSPDGAFVGATCTIRDEGGDEIAAGFVTRTTSGLTVSYGSLGDDGVSDVDPPLAPGTYEVRLNHEGYLTKTVEVAVEAGTSKDVQVTLEPKR